MSLAKIIEIAQGEIGYLEKKSNASLDNKTANAGSNNYNKYARDIWSSLQAQDWCDIFVSWCAEKAGEAAAVGKYAYVPSHVQFFKNKGQYFARGVKTPQAGDIIFFRDESHVGLVESVDGSTVTTIEGNTSGSSTLIPNGGGVFRKNYPLNSPDIQGYGRPAYTSGSSSKEGYTWGIDVSEWQGTNDWAKIKKAGCAFAIIRSSYRQKTDASFHENAKNAIAAGIPIGTYHFSYAKTAEEAKAEAEYAISVAKSYNLTLPIFFDWEYDSYNKAKAAGVVVDKTLYNDMAVAFCEAVTAAGYRAGVYYNLDYKNKFVDADRLKDYVVWYAQYASAPSISDYAIWQWSSEGSVDGVGSKNVDVDYLKDETLLIKTGWQKNDKGWWYVHTDGSYTVNNWDQINGEWYFFDDKGYMVANTVVEYEGKVYSFDADGHVTVSEKPVKGDDNAEEEIEVRYNTLGEVKSEHYRPTLDKLIEKGYLKGKGGEGDDMIIDFSEDTVRTLVILDRAGAFDK